MHRLCQKLRLVKRAKRQEIVALKRLHKQQEEGTEAMIQENFALEEEMQSLNELQQVEAGRRETEAAKKFSLWTWL